MVVLTSRCRLAREHGKLRHFCGSAPAHQLAARRRPFRPAPHPRDVAMGGRFASPRTARPPRATLAPAARLAVPQRGYGHAVALTPLAVRSFRSRSARNFSSVASRVERSRSGACSRGAPRQADLPPRPSRPCEGSLWPPRKRPPNAPRVGPPARRRELGGYVRICSPDHQPRTHSVSSQGLVQCV